MRRRGVYNPQHDWRIKAYYTWIGGMSKGEGTLIGLSPPPLPSFCHNLRELEHPAFTLSKNWVMAQNSGGTRIPPYLPKPCPFMAQLVEDRVQTNYLAKIFGMHFMKGLSISNHMGYSKKSHKGTTRFIKFQITFSVLLFYYYSR